MTALQRATMQQQTQQSAAQTAHAPKPAQPMPPGVALLQRTASNRAMGALIQRACKVCATSEPGAHEDDLREKIYRRPLGLSPKLAISQPGDPYEQEADRLADRVMRIASPSREETAPACGHVMNVGRSGTLETPTPVAADTLIPSGGGRPLDSSTRAFFEPRFGVNFGQVRVHTSETAAQASARLNARAFTFGNGVYFGAGAYQPATREGRRLLAHELTHVVQQGFALQFPLQPPSTDAGTGSGREAEAPGGESRVNVARKAPAFMLQRMTSEELMQAEERVRVGGTSAHTAIKEDFIAKVRERAYPIKTIPGATFRAKYHGCGDKESTKEKHFIPGERGEVDIAAYSEGSNEVEIAEIKPAHQTCVQEGRDQVNYYKRYANNSQQQRWRKENGLGLFKLMPKGRYLPGPTVTAYYKDRLEPVKDRPEPVSVAWHEDGLIFYKAVKKDPEIFLCSSIHDEGAVASYLNQGMERVQNEVNRYFNEVVDPKITQAMKNLSIREAVKLLYRYAPDALLDYVRGAYGIKIPPQLVERLPAEEVVNRIAGRVDAWLKGDVTEELFRRLLLRFKLRLLDQAREEVKAQSLKYLQGALIRACVAAAEATAVSFDWLLRELRKRLRYLSELAIAKTIPEVVRQIVQQTVNEALRILIKLVLIIVCVASAIAIAILLLPEAGIAGVIAAAAEAAVLLLRRLTMPR